MIQKIKKYIPTKRKIMQLYFALLFNANLKGFVSGNIYKGQSKQFCVPGINCYSCPGAQRKEMDAQPGRILHLQPLFRGAVRGGAL